MSLSIQADDLVLVATTITNPARVYIASLQSIRSRITMEQQLVKIAALLGEYTIDTCPWAALRLQHVQAIQSRLAERYSIATVNLMVSALRGVLRWAYDMEQIPEPDYRRLARIENLKGGDGNQAATGRALSQRELNALMDTCSADESALGARDAAIIALAYAVGARRAEIVGLNVGDIIREGEVYKVSIRGKGAKVRTAYLKGTFVQVVTDWLAVRGLTAGPLFLRQMLFGKTGDADQRLTTQSIYKLMLSRAKQAGIDTFSPHDLRRTCISNHLDAGTDMKTVADIVGHQSVETTAKYDRRGERAKQKAADNLHLAYTPGRTR